MKARFLFLAVMAVMMAFTGCTKEKIVYVEKESTEEENQHNIDLKEGEGIIKISLSDGMSRAARPIKTSGADNNINRIAFEFFQGGSELTGVKVAGILDDSDEVVEGTVNSSGTVLCIPSDAGANISVKFTELPENKSNCTIIAYGYNCEDGVYDFPYTITGGSSSSPLACNDISGNPVEEIFAGAVTDVNINQYGMFAESPTITLKRQVAGLMAYLSKVPAYVNETKVDRITINTNMNVIGFKFPASLTSDSEFNGIYSNNSYGVESVDLLTFTIPEGTKESGGYYQFNTTNGDGQKFLLADGMESTKYSDLRCEDNTLFGSCFILPFANHVDLYSYAEKATLNIIYWHKESEGTYSIIKTVLLKTANPPSGVTGTEFSTAYYQYDIRCNNFYSLGTKTKVSEGHDGNDIPSDDSPLNIDEPTGTMEASLTIDEEWTLNHDLTNRDE